MALLLLTVVRGDLMRNWRASLPPDAPNQFLVNVLPEQVDDARAQLARRVGRRRRVPADGARPARRGERRRRSTRRKYDDTRARRLAEREFNLSWTRRRCRRAIASSSGKFWTAQTRRGSAGMSLEDGIAETLGVKLGDTLTFDIAGNARDREA